jgi:uncharacterized RDD family membrane protein YckC
MNTILDHNIDGITTQNHYERATIGQRIVHHFVDLIAAGFCSVAVMQVAVWVGLINSIDDIDGSPLLLLFYAAFFAYYIVLEHYWGGKTIGKFMTQTHVLTKNYEKPSLGQIFGRNFGRIIPFDGFSYLFGGDIHDSVSGTIVVQD